ncbi:MAG TPA: tripartite tricarboxylate transporter substrate binding protein [Burkholderiaceae bacterium]|nr:tripartite tricarboxylate transporter substrate binding protein [Burkholderiaceae bacterium]
MRRSITAALGAAAVVASLGIAAPAGAQERPADWPSKPVRMVVPFAPGSTPDILARTIGERLTTALKQTFIVENRPGAGGNIGTNAVAKAAGDGYTIGVSITGPLVNNVVLYPKLPYDPFKELAPVTLAAIQPNVLVVSSELGVDNIKQFFDLLRRNPGKYNYASVGAGTVAHLSMELIKNKTNTFIVHIPYNSSPAAVTSMLSGDTQMAPLAPSAVLPQVRAGKLKALAVTTAERFPTLPDLPTFREIGIPEVVATAWIGIVVPASTPAPLVQRINEAFVAALKDPQVVERLRGQGMETVGNSPQAFARFMQDELARWGPVIKRSGVSFD